MTRHTEKLRTVYFIRPIGMQGPIKIGCSFSPDRRRASLETWSPFPLEIVAELAGSMDIERRLHSFFRHHHRSREWFDWTPQLQAVIDAVSAGTFSPATLPEPVSFSRIKNRDVSAFRDPAWRFTRSIDGRLRGLRGRGARQEDLDSAFGMSWWEALREIRMNGALAKEMRVRAVGAINALEARFPSGRRAPLTIPKGLAA